ncbi:MAG: 5'-nucleotidase C-terminal domain-containing protein [Coprobacillus sp.]|nr:5'-nucleotidase C-terminal domain-containing protein [Coprobacillus sp.]
MKHHYIALSLTALTLLLAGCNNKSPYSCKGVCAAIGGEPMYLVGYGSYVNGLNYDKDSGVALKTIESSRYRYVQEVTDLYLSVGDVFQIIPEEGEYIIENYNTDSEAFVGNNVTLYNDNQVDILKSGYYNIKVTYDGDTKEQWVDITFGKDTTDNLNPEVVTTPITIDFFANGDQHGVLEETQYNSETLPSMPEYVSFIYEQIENCEGSSILLSNGDLWQGTYESNFNYGALLNEIINEVGYVSFTLGNHEWDWGEEVIRENKSHSQVPYLAANVVYRDTEEIVNYAQPYTIVEKDGLKIGIIGVIGKGQITSITSTMVDDIEFLYEEDAIIEYSDRLRTEFGCDLVIASMHAGTSDERSTMRDLSKVSDVSGKPYVDAAFTAHDHKATYGTMSGLAYANSGDNNQNLSHISLTYDSGEVTYNTIENLSTSEVSETYIEDIRTRELIDTYCDDEIKNKGNEIVGSIDSTFSDTKEAPNMLAQAMYEYVTSSGYSIDVAICNEARAKLYKGDVTYRNLLDAYPFFNKTIIMEVTGIELSTVAKSNYYYSPDSSLSINATYSDTYTIAICDYLAFHTGTNRAYDNFFASSDPFVIKGELEKYPCDIVYDYIKGKGGSLLASDYVGSNFSFLS